MIINRSETLFIDAYVTDWMDIKFLYVENLDFF
jgi:hypothetical protein